MSLGLNLNLGLLQPAGQGTAFDLFEYDENTLYFDPASALNTTEDTAPVSLGILPDLIADRNRLVQPTKSLQPLVTADGMDFNNDTARKLTFNETGNIANGHGYYLVANIKPITNGTSTIFMVAKNGNSNASRGLFFYTSSRYLGFMADSNDGNSVAFIGYSTNKLVNGTWNTVAVSLFADGVTTNPLRMWINGTEETLQAENASAFTIPANEPFAAYVGNQYQSTGSFNGGMGEMILQNANTDPAGSMRQSMDDYLNTQRAGL